MIIFTVEREGIIVSNRQDRRDNIRVKYLNSLFFKPWNFIPRGQKDHFKEADIINICSDGVRIKTRSSDTTFEVGSTLCLKIPFPGMPVVISIFGKVKWLKAVSFTSREAGIQFITWE
jgi:hypothetical protein